jgi:uncharacterized protein (DUF1786 family)
MVGRSKSDDDDDEPSASIDQSMKANYHDAVIGKLHPDEVMSDEGRGCHVSTQHNSE